MERACCRRSHHQPHCCHRYRHYYVQFDLYVKICLPPLLVVIYTHSFQNVPPPIRTARYLEPLFIQSDEVKKELPETAQHFAKIDLEIKGLLQAMWKKRNAIQAANIEGNLEGLQCQLPLLPHLHLDTGRDLDADPNHASNLGHNHNPDESSSPT